MANIYLDTNIFISIVKTHDTSLVDYLKADTIYLSVLSVHISHYVLKRKVPDLEINVLLESINLIPLDQLITEKSVQGPTDDFEDNVQLHSAAEAEADIFVTEDKKLLKLKYFGKMKVVSPKHLP